MKELGEVKLALEAFSAAEDLLDLSELDSAKLVEVREIIQESKVNIHEKVSNSEAPVFKESEEFQLEDVHDQTEELSSSLRVRHEARQGRHVVAERDLSVGDLLAVEEATVWRLMPGPQLRRICCHCLLESLTPLPCPKCAGVR